MNAVELFAGAGGLGMGISLAGFHHVAVVEWDHDACNTLRENRRRRIKPIAGWPEIHEGDVREFDFKAIDAPVDLISGGPPCQPFSLGGKHRAFRDHRDMWPQAARAVRELRPRAFIFENVRGLVRPRFAEYFRHVVLRLTYPEIVPLADEEWTKHLARLERYDAKETPDGLHYKVAFQLLNTCDYGVPQRRERVVLVGFRSDLDVEWSFPLPSHSQEALFWSQWVDGAYWQRHRVAGRDRPSSPPGQLTREMFAPTMKPWMTVRDALVGLPEPKETGSKEVLNHRLRPGARPYPGHIGSPLDEPAKALKAGDHGVPGGENMLLRPDGSVRYFTVRESARLQTFPEKFSFDGSWTESMRQLGNAVPVVLGEVVGRSVHDALTGADTMCPTEPRASRGGRLPAIIVREGGKIP